MISIVTHDNTDKHHGFTHHIEKSELPKTEYVHICFLSPTPAWWCQERWCVGMQVMDDSDKLPNPDLIASSNEVSLQNTLHSSTQCTSLTLKICRRCPKAVMAAGLDQCIFDKLQWQQVFTAGKPKVKVLSK